ncbi:MAG: dethiobiotin synthase [Solirubrobacteraceae bacterium]
MKNNFKTIFVTGIGTDVGKTIVSAILTEALETDYWKPVQSGTSEGLTDLLQVKNLVSNTTSKFHTSIYELKTAVSPHLAAKIEGVKIKKSLITLKNVSNNLLIEGAGGLLVPLNNKKMVIDLIKKNYYVVLVSKNYLGSINHTLLSINYLKNNGFKKIGVIFSGIENKDSEEIIKKQGKVTIIGRVELINEIEKTSIIIAGEKIKSSIKNFLDSH